MITPLEMRPRDAEWRALGDGEHDVLVIGGGITGAGIARDAAMRGLRVALAEQHDFASGTSSRSSRLVHGGLRYLEHAQLRMVFESSRERRILLRVAPHLVRPLRFTWPVYRGDRVPRWKIGAGLTLYDALSLFRNVARHRRLSAGDVVEFEPELRTAGLSGGASYYDARTDDARLTLANVLSAREYGATLLNHACVTSISHEGDRVNGAVVVDAETQNSIAVRARIVVNATGPWSERVESLAHPTPKQGIRASKGVHVCVPRARVGNTSAVTVTAPQDGRVMFILPADDFTIIGTTDTFDTVSPDDVHASWSDVDYLLTACNHYYPGAKLLRDDVVSAWAGLRPLAASTSAAENPGGVSREHAIAETVPGLIRVTGGKLTTYRAMAEEIVDLVQRKLGQSVSGCRTADVTLPDRKTATIAALIESDQSLSARLDPTRPCILADLRYAIENEMARTLGDMLIRRTPIAFETRDHGQSAARTAAPHVAKWLGWDSAQIAGQLSAFDAESARMFAIR